jgi:hypothetical protein
MGLAVGNARVLAGAVARRLREEEHAPPELVHAIRDLSCAVKELAAEVEEHRDEHESQRYAVEATRRAAAVAVADDAHDLATLVIVHQVESTAYDLLRGGGVEADRAHEAVSA